jgi:hypothetical protein
MEQEHNPVAKVNEIDLVNDPSTSFWLRSAIQNIPNRDIVDYLNDVEILLSVLQNQFHSLQEMLSLEPETKPLTVDDNK